MVLACAASGLSGSFARQGWALGRSSDCSAGMRLRTTCMGSPQAQRQRNALFDGRKLRMLTVLDCFTRECLAIDIGQSLKGEDVVDSLNPRVRQFTASMRCQTQLNQGLRSDGLKFM